MNHGFVQVVTTTPTQEEAERVARILVERRLAACVQVIGPVRSTFRWKGTVERENEWLCTAKTTDEALQAVQRTIRENHSYEVPEVVVVRIEDGDPDYLAWLAVQVAPR